MCHGLVGTRSLAKTLCEILAMNSFIARPWFVFFIGFILPFLMTKINFVSTVGGMSEETEKIIYFSIVAYFLGLIFCYFFRYCLGGRISINPLRDKVYVRNLSLLYLFLFSWFFLGAACLFYEFHVLGGIPVLSGNVEELRFNVQVNGYVHLLAISLGIVSTLFVVSASFFSGLKKVVFLFFGGLGFVFLALTGNRSDSMLCLVVIFLYFMFKGGVMLRARYFLFGSFILLAFVLLKFYREVAYGVDYIGMIESQLVGQPSFVKYIFYPLYMTLTYGYMVLDMLVNAGAEGMGGGRYTFYAFYSLIPGPQVDFGVFKNELLGIDFYAELTSTVVSNFYVDFGLVGVCLCVFIMAIVLGAVFSVARKNNKYAVLYAVLYLHTLIFFYVYIYVYLFAIIHVLIYLFYCFFFLGVERDVCVSRKVSGC